VCCVATCATSPSGFYNIAASLPAFDDDPVRRLRHTVAAHRATNRANWAVTATAGGVYPGHDRTGLTYGDLEALAARIEYLTAELDAIGDIAYRAGETGFAAAAVEMHRRAKRAARGEQP
jgi:hypothetical protein